MSNGQNSDRCTDRSSRQTTPEGPFNVAMPSLSHLTSEELAAYIDGRTEPSAWERMTSHLAACGVCRQELLAVLRLIRGELGREEAGPREAEP
jgi:hypothetical protein